jgi:integrase
VPGGRRSYTAKTEGEAKRWLRQAQAEAIRGRLAAKQPPTLAAYLTNTWLPMVGDSLKSRTRVSYRTAIARVPKWIGATRLDELKPAHFQKFYQELTAAKKAPRTVRQTHMVLHKALEDALPLDLVNHNPTEGVRLPRIPQSEPQWYTDEELAQLFDATAAHRFHALWVILGTLGLRVSEARGLKWSDIDWNQKTIRVVRTLARDREQGALVFSELKTKNSRRTLPLGTLAVDALKAHGGRQRFEKRRAGSAYQDQKLIFCTIYGGPLDLARIHEHWTPAVKAAGLPRYTVHALRHSVASNLIRAGCDPFRVAQLLGHRNANMVIQVYGHLRPDDHQTAAAMMEALVSSHRQTV